MIIGESEVLAVLETAVGEEHGQVLGGMVGGVAEVATEKGAEDESPALGARDDGVIAFRSAGSIMPPLA